MKDFWDDPLVRLVIAYEERQAAIAAGSRRAKTPKAVECEASQSGGETASPTPCHPTTPSGKIDEN